LEFGAFGLPHIRHETISLNLPRPVRLLYASDLHLGHWWTASVPHQLLSVAAQLDPDLILLGGDLTDNVSAIDPLHELVRQLDSIAPVCAIPGNHDVRAGIDTVCAAVRSAGAHWLAEEGIEHPVPIEGTVRSGAGASILCAHAPSIFPAAVQAGYRLVLAGHLHGGQCVLATWKDKQYPAAWFHRWHGLRFQQGDATLLVSRGLADTFPLRFNCPREVLLCEIV
jgi:predicted MPP superfamily phosphohydrolase